MLWDELACLMPIQGCACGLCKCNYGKANAETNTLNQLMQFLMGLNESYDNLRNQMLVMEPLPSVNKAYSMVLRVEKQRQIHSETCETNDGVAFNVKWNTGKGFDNRQEQVYRGKFKKRDDIDKKSQYCTYCEKPGHTRETCFKLHGFPDWYKALMDQKRREGKGGFKANLAQEKPVDVRTECGDINSPAFSEAVRQELMKLIKGKMQQDPLQVHFAHTTDDFAGIGCALDDLETNGSNFWIVDTGATNHMCARLDMLTKPHSATKPTQIFLPDGTSHAVKLMGTATLHENLILTNVLYVPKFSYNLLSVQKLCISSNIRFVFFSSHCLIQDLKSDKIIGVGRLLGSLYIVDISSFDPSLIQKYAANKFSQH